MPTKSAPLGNHSRGYLPHLIRPDAFYFVTFRLADSLPKSVLLELERELSATPPTPPTTHRNRNLGRDLDAERRKQIERYLDSGAGSCALSHPQIASFAADMLLTYHQAHYFLDDWVIMPNHIHAILQPLNNTSLSRVLQRWKGSIAFEANRILGKTGTRFWQPESFDRIIRHEQEKQNARRYIRNNPVKANLCKTPEEWPWGSAGFKLRPSNRQPPL